MWHLQRQQMWYRIKFNLLLLPLLLAGGLSLAEVSHADELSGWSGRELALTPHPSEPVTTGPFAGVTFTPEQQIRLQQMMLEQQYAHQKRLLEIAEIQQALSKLYLAEYWDVAAIDAAYGEIFKRQQQTFRAMAEARNEIYALLSPEQKQSIQSPLQPRTEGN
ncbi:MAG: Spy/CpxP family protein refolding chaperone [Gammaproteobacteria bacterium]|nr:Spy/CpxP family protein refolding chaperone [Gammaproteobacteria bacterium]